MDGTSGDAANAIDGAPFDAGAEAGFCAANPGHALCDDFDDDAWRAPWNLADIVTPPGSIGLDPSGFVSAPSSLLVANAPMDAAASAYLDTRFNSTPSSLHVAFDFSLVEGGGSPVAVTNVSLAGQTGFALKLTQPIPRTLEIVEVARPDGGAFVYSILPGASLTVDPGQWYHVDVTFDLSGADAGEVDVSYDHGALVVAKVPEPLPVDMSQPFNLQAGVGSYSAGPYLPATVRLDNFVVDTK